MPGTSRCRLAGCPARRRPKPPSPGRVRSSAGGGPGPTVRSAIGQPRWRWSLAGKEHARSLLRAINHASEAHGEAGPDSSRICREGGRRRALGRWSARPALAWSRRGRPRASGGAEPSGPAPVAPLRCAEHPRSALLVRAARSSYSDGLLSRVAQSGCSVGLLSRVAPTGVTVAPLCRVRRAPGRSVVHASRARRFRPRTTSPSAPWMLLRATTLRAMPAIHGCSGSLDPFGAGGGARISLGLTRGAGRPRGSTGARGPRLTPLDLSCVAAERDQA